MTNNDDKLDLCKPIETSYKGYRFRSRLEARWAVYFDAIGLKWQYEPEGFEFKDGTRYLPDFWLPQVKMWAEVKHEGGFANEELYKIYLLVRGTGKGCILLDGMPDERCYRATIYCSSDTWAVHRFIISGHYLSEDEPFLPRFPNSTSDSPCENIHFAQGDCFDDVRPAINAARAARFEFDECATPESPPEPFIAEEEGLVQLVILNKKMRKLARKTVNPQLITNPFLRVVFKLCISARMAPLPITPSSLFFYFSGKRERDLITQLVFSKLNYTNKDDIRRLVRRFKDKA